MKPPFSYFGGKQKLSKTIISIMPAHIHLFVEVFGGSGAVLFAKEPNNLEVYNDVDSGLVNFFRVIRDSEQFQKFYSQVLLLPYSREEYYFCARNWRIQKDPIMKAVLWYAAMRQSFSGMFGKSWGHSRFVKQSKCVNAYLSSIELLPDISQRLMHVQIESMDCIELIKKYDSSESFFYCDPPYVSYTRKDGQYQHEISYQKHSRLLDLLAKIKGKFILSGYPSKLYKEHREKNNWKNKIVVQDCSSKGRTYAINNTGEGAMKFNKREELLMWNY